MNDVTSGARHPLDAMIASRENHAVLLENDRVRVLDTSLAPGATTAVHSHEWPAALYVLSWSDFIRYDPDGKVLVDSAAMGLRPQAGSTIWAEPLPPHCVKNVGDSDLHIIAVELKPAV
jgi:quercetin dioxygenase-like cupin family protein